MTTGYSLADISDTIFLRTEQLPIVTTTRLYFPTGFVSGIPRNVGVRALSSTMFSTTSPIARIMSSTTLQ